MAQALQQLQYGDDEADVQEEAGAHFGVIREMPATRAPREAPYKQADGTLRDCGGAAMPANVLPQRMKPH